MSFFSVIIPTFNRSDVILRAIKSVLSNSFTELELIVVDDASTDNTFELLNNIKDPRFKFLCLKEKSNANVARNAGVALSKGQFICFLDSDDEFANDYLENVYKFLTSHKDARILLDSFRVITSKKNSVINYPAGTCDSDCFSMALARHAFPITCSNMVVEKSLIEDSKGFDSNFFRQQDRDFLMTICSYEKKIHLTNNHGVFKYQSKSSISRSSSNYLEPLILLFNKHASIFIQIEKPLRHYLLARGLLQTIKTGNVKSIVKDFVTIKRSKSISYGLIQLLFSYSYGKKMRKAAAVDFLKSVTS